MFHVSWFHEVGLLRLDPTLVLQVCNRPTVTVCSWLSHADIPSEFYSPWVWHRTLDYIHMTRAPNVLAECLILQLRIRKFPGSNLGPETGYPELSFPLFSSVPPGEWMGQYLKLGYDRFLPNPYKFIINLSPFYSTLYSLSYWKASLNYK
jgi:hypothetical protein